MLYIFHGSDTQKTRQKAHVFLDTLFKKRPDARLFRIDADSFDGEEVRRLIEEQGLFEAKHIVLLDRVHENKDMGAELATLAPDMAASPNMFVILEEALTKKELAPLQKHAQDVYVHDKAKAAKKEEVNIFALTDAFGARNKAKTWALYQQAIGAGKTPEEIHGLLHWQVKSMLLARSAGSAKEAGLNPFVYKKSRSTAEKFGTEELSAISNQLVSTYHESRMGKGELTENLELLILRVL